VDNGKFIMGEAFGGRDWGGDILLLCFVVKMFRGRFSDGRMFVVYWSDVCL
jgi:hypothetical protein